MIETELCKSLKKFNSDKCDLSTFQWHNYSIVYSNLFEKMKEMPINIFEVGIFNGSSVRAWEEYFINGNIYAGDYDRTLLINEGRIKSYYCNQDDVSSINNMWLNDDLKDLEFDIIMDDGKHEFESNYNFLISSVHKLKPGGYFIVEDLTNGTYTNFEQILPELKTRFNLSTVELKRIPHSRNNTDNNLLIIQK